MNIRTYLMIKSAGSPRYASDATPEEIAEWAGNELAGQNALKQVPELQAQLDEAIDKNNRYYFDNSKREADLQSQLRKAQQSNEALNRDYGILQQIHSKNVSDLAANRKYTKDLEDIYNEDTAKYTALQDHTKDKDPLRYVKEIEKEYSRADAKNQGRANTIRRQAAEIDAMNNRFTTAQENARRALAAKDSQIANQANTIADNMSSMNRMRRNASIGGAVAGGVIGGGLGYMGSNALSKKLGLQGPNVSKGRRVADIALRTLGTAGGAGLGGYGGYLLGQNI